jgi:hypothetical protein
LLKPKTPPPLEIIDNVEDSNNEVEEPGHKDEESKIEGKEPSSQESSPEKLVALARSVEG